MEIGEGQMECKRMTEFECETMDLTESNLEQLHFHAFYRVRSSVPVYSTDLKFSLLQ